MKILYCNVALASRSGTEIVTIETARMLQRLGHDVCIYTSNSGPSSAHLIQDGIPVVTHLDRLPWQPDVIHSNHLPQSIETAVRFPDTPQIFVCHDAEGWRSHPPALSVIRRWVAVDERCAERIERAIVPSPPVLRLMNAVDTDAYRRRAALPATARTALALVKHSSHIRAIKAACRNAGLHLDIVGPAAGNAIDDLPQRLPGYDIVFATARMALEAMAVGCSVIVVDGRGLAGLVTSGNMSEWRRHNFGQRLLTKAVNRDNLLQEIKRYDPLDAAIVSDFIRKDASLSDYAGRLVGVYEEAIADFKSVPTNPSQTLREVFEATLGLMGGALTDLLFLGAPGTPSLSWLGLVRGQRHYRCLVRFVRWKTRARAWKLRIWDLVAGSRPRG